MFSHRVRPPVGKSDAIQWSAVKIIAFRRKRALGPTLALPVFSRLRSSVSASLYTSLHCRQFAFLAQPDRPTFRHLALSIVHHCFQYSGHLSTSPLDLVLAYFRLSLPTSDVGVPRDHRSCYPYYTIFLDKESDMGSKVNVPTSCSRSTAC